jgi:hypothetical protein
MGIVTFNATYHYQHLERQFSVPSVDEIFNEVATLAAAVHLPAIFFSLSTQNLPGHRFNVMLIARRDSSFFIEKIIEIEIPKILSKKIEIEIVEIQCQINDYIFTQKLTTLVPARICVLSPSDIYA